MTGYRNRDEEIFNAYAAGMAVEHIAQRFGASQDEVRRIVAADLAHGEQESGPRVDAEEIINAYAAGTSIGQIRQRFGVSEDEVRRIVAADLRLPDRPGARRQQPGLAIAGGLLMAICGGGPCVLGAGWLVLYYLSAAEYPVASWGGGNVAVGLAAAGIGVTSAILGAVLFVLSRRK